MRTTRSARLSLAVLLAVGGALVLSPARAAPFEISDGWFRSLPGTLPAGGYFTARNNTDHELVIMGVRSDGCMMVMMHRSTAKGGMSGMDMVSKVPVPAGGMVKFAPGGYHLMCERPNLKLGRKVAVQFTLSDASTVTVPFAVRNAAGK